MDKFRSVIEKFMTLCVCGVLASRIALQILDVLNGKVPVNQVNVPLID